MPVFEDRIEAGRQLAVRLGALKGSEIVVLGLPRGGVPVAAEVAEALEAPLDVIVVRKLGVPSQPELAMGAIGESGVRVLDHRVLAMTHVSKDGQREVEDHERAHLEARSERFRHGRARMDLTGRVALIIDDGIATGSTARAACQVARRLGAARVILAVPVAPRDTVEHFADANEVICLATPPNFRAVGYHYRDFSPTTEEEVTDLLDAAARRVQLAHAASTTDSDLDVTIPVDGIHMKGHLRVPDLAAAVVIFTHGSGSSRYSPLTRFVADVLNEAGLGTLLIDLLTPDEEVDPSNVFNIELLTRRLVAATNWLAAEPATAACQVGYFGASTGAGTALRTAGELAERIFAVVSHGGRPELAGPAIGLVTAPTLLIVSGADTIVLELNRKTMQSLHCENRLEIVEGATRLFVEPRALVDVTTLARDWFVDHVLEGTNPPAKGPQK